jgi:hypothetical protein
MILMGNYSNVITLQNNYFRSIAFKKNITAKYGLKLFFIYIYLIQILFYIKKITGRRGF